MTKTESPQTYATLTSAELDAADLKTEYLVSDVLARHPSTSLATPKKRLKTKKPNRLFVHRACISMWTVSVIVLSRGDREFNLVFGTNAVPPAHLRILPAGESVGLWDEVADHQPQSDGGLGAGVRGVCEAGRAGGVWGGAWPKYLPLTMEPTAFLSETP